MLRGWLSLEHHHNPRAGAVTGTAKDAAVMMYRRRGAPAARQPALHEALVDADVLDHVLEDDEQQRDEPEQHQLCMHVDI